jgi:hypothetical protein
MSFPEFKGVSILGYYELSFGSTMLDSAEQFLLPQDGYYKRLKIKTTLLDEPKEFSQSNIKPTKRLLTAASIFTFQKQLMSHDLGNHPVRPLEMLDLGYW